MRQTLLLCISLVSAGTLYAQNFNKAKIDSLFTILDQKEKYMGSITLSENGKMELLTLLGHDSYTLYL